jgi:asparagine N-glycosylation enzyme membrane subunit Stt3
MSLRTATLIALVCWAAFTLSNLYAFVQRMRYGGFDLDRLIQLASLVSLVIFLFVLHAKQKNTGGA